MCPRIENAAVRARLVPRAKLICWTVVLSGACLAYSAWAGPQDERPSRRVPRFDQRTLVPLGFIANDEPLSQPQPVEYQRDGTFEPIPVGPQPHRERQTAPPEPMDDQPTGPALTPIGGRIDPRASFWQSTRNKLHRRE